MIIDTPPQIQDPESALILKASVFYTTVGIVVVIIVLCMLL